MRHKWILLLLVSWWLGALAACFPSQTAVSSPTLSIIAHPPVEQMMLDATVRLALETWLVNEGERGYTILKSEGHGTVVNVRFLITHNHHTIPLSLSEAGLDPDIYTQLFIYNAAGELINTLPFTDFQIGLREPQTLLLVYVGEQEVEPFGTVGLSIEQVLAGTAVPLETDTEIAQIDWNGSNAHVDWTVVTAVYPQPDPPCLELAHQPQIGASGGGIFWQGQHIGNTWLKGTRISAANGESCQYSKAALNSPELLAYLTAHAPP